MSNLAERWRAQMSRPHVVIHELREIGTALADENARLRAENKTLRNFLGGIQSTVNIALMDVEPENKA